MSFVDVAIASPGSEPLPFPPENVVAVGDVYEFTPHGQAFAKPVLVRIPFNPALVPA